MKIYKLITAILYILLILTLLPVTGCARKGLHPTTADEKFVVKVTKHKVKKASHTADAWMPAK
jgi:predicted small lipoprotein YifL